MIPMKNLLTFIMSLINTIATSVSIESRILEVEEDVFKTHASQAHQRGSTLPEKGYRWKTTKRTKTASGNLGNSNANGKALIK